MEHDLNKRIAALTPDKIKQLIMKTAGKRSTLPSVEKVKRQPRDGRPFPLSYAQERIWFLCQLAPDSSAYNNPLAVRVRADTSFDPHALEQGLNEIVRRHEILRTTFHCIDGKPYQVIAPKLQLKIDFQDLRPIPHGRREAEAVKIAIQEGQYSFDLEKGPLLRFQILRLEDKEYILLITTHHLVSDGWSNGVFAHQLAVLSEALSQHRPSPLPEPTIQYADYAVWEREWLQGERLQRLLSFWKQQLSREIPHLHLPTDHPRPSILGFSGAMEVLMLPTRLTDQLKNLSRLAGVTLFQTMLAVFYVLLYRYTGETDLVVGSPAVNRNRKEFQNLLGLFMNTLVLRTNAAGTPPFKEFLLQVRQVCQQAFAHQELPFEKLVRELQPQRDLGGHPFFQVMFAQQSIPQLPGTPLKPFKVDYGTAKFDLDLWMEETDKDLWLTLFYYKDLFNASTIKRILNHYRVLLEAICAHPDQRISHLPLMPDSELTYVLTAWNRTGGTIDQKECIHHRFEAQAAVGPDSPAVESPQSLLTYASLNNQANQLAHYLRYQGVGAETVVGLLIERSPAMIIGLLGILKAGGAYVPLDPELPPERLTYILEDSRANLLVAQETFAGIIESPKIIIIYLDTRGQIEVLQSYPVPAPGPAKKVPWPPQAKVTGSSLVYVIYTSGTTGKPKGVALEHRQLLHYVDAIGTEMALPPGSRLATVSTLAADLGNTAIFPALCTGACLVVLPHEMTSTPHQLAAYCERNPIDCLKIVPSHLSALLSSNRAQYILPRKLLILGGEASSYSLIERIKALGPDCRILNHYGPTEATIGVLTYPVPHIKETGRSRHLPLGQPLARTRILILDRNLQPVPVGAAGELYIGGEGLARGYLNQPELTAEKFCLWPPLLYRTGDQVRVLADGSIGFLGRMDRQVKIRGFRVELQEIEAVLAAHPQVDQAVINISEANDPKLQLTAYVVLKDPGSTGTEELRHFLEARLPTHMIPNRLVFLETIPVTANGKVDYRALPAVPLTASKQGNIAPRDTVELELAKIWEQVLDIESVSINQNFFQLGGHSLLAVQIMTRIHDVFHQQLPLAILFQYGTIEQLAVLLRKKHEAIRPSPLAALQPRGSRTPLFFVHPAGGNVLCYYDLARCLGNRQPFYGLQVSSFIDPTAVHNDIREMARYYVKAVTEVMPGGPYLLGGWSMGAVVAFEMAQQLVQQGKKVPLLAILDQKAPDRAESLNTGSQEDETMQLSIFAHKVEQLSGKTLALSYRELQDKNPQEQTKLFLEQFKANNLVPADTRLEDFSGFLAVQKAHNRAASRYIPEIYPGPLVLFQAQEHLQPPPPQEDPTLGWQHWVSGPLQIQPVPGNHITMMSPPHVRVLAEKLNYWLSTGGINELKTNETGSISGQWSV